MAEVFDPPSYVDVEARFIAFAKEYTEYPLEKNSRPTPINGGTTWSYHFKSPYTQSAFHGFLAGMHQRFINAPNAT